MLGVSIKAFINALGVVLLALLVGQIMFAFTASVLFAWGLVLLVCAIPSAGSWWWRHKATRDSNGDSTDIELGTRH